MNEETTMRRMTSMLAAAGAVLLSGCAATHHGVSEIDWEHGARRARVMSAYAPDAPAATLPPCLAALPAQDYASRRFVRVRYHHVKIMLYAVAEQPAGMDLHPDDHVELWPENCGGGKLSRIGKVMP